MNVGSLFSGIGGIELGFERAGFKTIWFVESDRYAQEVLKKNFPKTPIYDDITTLDFRAVPKVDIITGGFPCQDISTAGKGVGIKGSRSSLWKYYKKAIGVLRPRYAFIENVPMLVSRGLNVVLADLAEIGYDAEWYNLSASAVGAFHKRERIFIIAYRNNIRLSEKPTSGEGRKFGNKTCIETESCYTYATNMQESRSRGLSIPEWRQKKESIDIDRSSKDASNTEGKRAITVQQQGQRNGFVEKNKNVANTESIIKKRTDSERHNGRKQKEKIGSRGMYKNANTDYFGLWKQGVLQRNTNGFIETESRICGVVDGVPYRVDRIRCLGNAVVPPVAEVFAKAIKEKEEKEKIIIERNKS